MSKRRDDFESDNLIVACSLKKAVNALSITSS